MIIRCIWEHNGNDTLLYAMDHIGAYTRGENLAAAKAKMPAEIASYLKWLGKPSAEHFEVVVAQEKISDLQIRDADSDVLFDSEKVPLRYEEYESLKALALRSAGDFQKLYDCIPDKDAPLAPVRKTFYGQVPSTARQMYIHTMNVNAYYYGEIGVDADNEGDILTCRQRGFESLAVKQDFLENAAIEGSYGEYWTLRKMLRRFVWHDRIHAKAMYRRAVQHFGTELIANPFYF